MLELYMKKISLLYFVLLSSVVWASEPTIAILESVISNSEQKFRLGKAHFICEAYGIITPQKLSKTEELSESCKKSLESFYLKNPYKKHFSLLHLYEMQSYRVEFKEQKCLLYARGKSTLSEILLREGLALLELNFADKEYKNLYTYAQKNAQIKKRGIWGDNLRRDCLAEIYK